MSRLMSLSNRQVLGLLVLVALVCALISLGRTKESTDDWLSGLTSNLATEMVGAVITFFMFEIIIGGRQEQEKTAKQIANEKARFIRDLGSRVNEVAIKATEELRAQGWLENGSLEKVKLDGANLQGANLDRANLQGVSLMKANLQGADLWEVNLQGANLSSANLHGTFLTLANLQGANLMRANLHGTFLNLANLQEVDLQRANLQGADLWEVNLQGANLDGANLQGVDLYEAVFDENTVLPDGTKWTAETDMRRFTDPEHPQFWRSDNPFSPAYKGKSEE